MFVKQQAVSHGAMNKARDTYSAQHPKGKEMGLEKAAQAEPVRWSEKDTHDIEGMQQSSVDPNAVCPQSVFQSI